MMRTVSILGVGWLGLPLARKLISSGYKVKGSVTSTEKMETLQQKAIWPFQVIASPDGLFVNDLSFFDTDILIIAIPPRRIRITSYNVCYTKLLRNCCTGFSVFHYCLIFVTKIIK